MLNISVECDSCYDQIGLDLNKNYDYTIFDNKIILEQKFSLSLGWSYNKEKGKLYCFICKDRGNLSG